MTQGFFIWLLTLVLAQIVIVILWPKNLKKIRFCGIILFLYHSLLALIYYLYAMVNASDSKGYYSKVVFNYRGPAWSDFYGTSTTFIEFVGYPFIKFAGFSYESMMVLFSFFGFLGFFFFCIFFKERIKVEPKLFGLSFLLLIFFLPNLHFWSASYGKGSLIFAGFGLFFYALNNPPNRIFALLTGGYIVYMVRPHVLFVLLIAVVLGYVFSSRGVGAFVRLVVLGVSVTILVFIYDDIVQLTGLEDESVFSDNFSERAERLSNATSGVDLTGYSLPEKLFTFWFRPLFFDANGILGFIISFENVFYLFTFLSLMRGSAFSFLLKADAITKTCLFAFLGVSLALSQISSNLGLAMRQKSQVMILMMFVILKFFEQQEIINLKRVQWRKKLVLRNKEKGMTVLKG